MLHKSGIIGYEYYQSCALALLHCTTTVYKPKRDEWRVTHWLFFEIGFRALDVIPDPCQ